MPGGFAAPAHQSPHDIIQPSQERSLVLFRPVPQNHDTPSPPVSPIHHTEPIDLAGGTANQSFTTTPLPTHTAEDPADRGSVTPKPGDAALHSPSRDGSQSPPPPRRNTGKGRMVQPYSDEEDSSRSEEDRDANMADAGGGSAPRERPRKACLVFSLFDDQGADAE